MKPQKLFSRENLASIKQDTRTIVSIFWNSHLLSLIKNPFTLVARLASIGLATFRNFLHFFNTLPSSSPPRLANSNGMDLQRWHRKLNRMLYYRPQLGTAELLVDGDAYYTELLSAIDDSQASVELRVYIFDSDDVATEVADHLKNKPSNVRVRVLMDDLGSLFAARKGRQDSSKPIEAINDIDQYLKEDSSIDVYRSPNPWFTGDHNKVIIIDRNILFTGGMNIGREYRYDWHDVMLKVQGPIISVYEKQFEEAWAHAGLLGDLGQFLAFLKPRRKDIPVPNNSFPIHTLTTSSLRSEIFKVSLKAIKWAKKEIFLENPYLSNKALISAIIKARHRGVDVRIIFPIKNDIDIMKKSNEILVNVLLEHGIRVYMYPKMSHVKAIYVDGWVSIGSANYDMLSLHVNQESNIAFSDPETVATIRKELFEKDFEDSKEVLTPNDIDWSHHVSEIIANQL